MKFSPNTFYHIFNRGNNKQKIFFHEKNYQFFLRKIEEYLCPNCQVVAYCLMPNHFHLLIYVENAKNLPSARMQILERKIGTLQSSYTRAINIQERRTGSLFQAKCKVLETSAEHALACFHYIHQNPLKSGLCRSLDAWSYSSFREYLDSENFAKPVCTREVAYNLLGVPKLKEGFLMQSYKDIPEKNFIDIFKSSDH
jgi:putative transposase